MDDKLSLDELRAIVDKLKSKALEPFRLTRYQEGWNAALEILMKTASRAVIHPPRTVRDEG